MDHGVDWVEPWYGVDDADIRVGLEQQLAREICDRHVLAGAAVRLIARRSDTDDALFMLSDGRVAEVHLTWRDRRELDPRWPVTAIFDTLQCWARDSMLLLHEELLGGG